MSIFSNLYKYMWRVSVIQACICPMHYLGSTLRNQTTSKVLIRVLMNKSGLKSNYSGTSWFIKQFPWSITCESVLEYFNSFYVRVLWDNEGHIVYKWAYPCRSEVKDQFVNMLSDSLLVFGQYVKCHTFSFKCFDRHYYETYRFPIYILT